MQDEIVIPAKGVRSLAWSADFLIDWASGGTRYGLDGTKENARVIWAFPFDAVAATNGSDYAVIYARYGTKALLLRNNTLIRELNRSFYCAEAYEYPVCLVKRDERTLLIHCPEEYNLLQIEDAETGECLTHRTSKPVDFFHSRLQTNASGTRLLSAGWVWHPWDTVTYFDIEEALRQPEHLDSPDWIPRPADDASAVEESSACWLTDTRSVVAGGDRDTEKLFSNELALRPRGLAVYDVAAKTILSSVTSDMPAGVLMPIDKTHVVTFFHHPRLVRLFDGHVEKEWRHIDSGEAVSSISGHLKQTPPLAFEPGNRRFAIAQDDGIHVLTLRI